MRTTFTLDPRVPRVCSQMDFLALGEGVRVTPGWRHFVVDFEFDLKDEFRFVRLADLDDRELSLPLHLDSAARRVVEKHCRAYANLMERIKCESSSPSAS